MRKVYTLLFALTVFGVAANAQSGRNLKQAVANGNWNAGATWSGGTVPANSDSIVIPSGRTVTLTADVNLTDATLDIMGTFTLNEPGGGSNDITFTMNSGTTTTPVVRLALGGTINRGTNSGGTGRIRVRISGNNYTKYTTGASSLVGPLTAYYNTNTTFAAGNANLPVVLVSFDAVKQNNAVNITLSTQQEFNTDIYSKERSFDGANYTSIGKVAAAGNATTPRSYSYSDAAPARGIAYYRIRIVDMDGKTGFTTVKAIRAVASGAKVSVYPNPAVNVANIVVNNTDNQAFALNVFNRNGQLVSQKRASAGTTAVALEVAGMPAGDYIIDVNFADGSRQSSILVVGKQ